MKPASKPSPIQPLDYATPVPPTTAGTPRLWLGMRPRRLMRLIYLVVCSIGLFFAIKYLMGYVALIDDAMKPMK